MKEVAEMAGVSPSTASRAIRGHPDVNAETQHKVLEAAERLGYYPSTLARGLVSGTSMMIGLLVADITNPSYPKLP